MARPAFPKSLSEFQAWFDNEEACLHYLVESRWPDGYACPPVWRSEPTMAVVSSPKSSRATSLSRRERMAFNLGLVMRKITGMGTPRGLHSLLVALGAIGNLLKPAFDLFAKGHGAFRALTRKWVLKTGCRPTRPNARFILHNIGFSTGC